MAEIDPRYASPGLRWGVYLEDHPDATVDFTLATAAELGIPESFAGAGELVVATIHTPGRPDVIGYKEISDQEERWTGSAGNRRKELVDVERDPELWQVLCTKALGRAVKRAGYPDHLPDLKALVLWRQRRAELDAMIQGRAFAATAVGALEAGLDAAAVTDAETPGADDVPVDAELVTPVEPSVVDVATDPLAGSPAGEGIGKCRVPGCERTDDHVHDSWEAARAQGRLTPQAAAGWDVALWATFLRDHDIGQAQAVDALRTFASQNELDVPKSLLDVRGSPRFAAILLDMATPVDA